MKYIKSFESIISDPTKRISNSSRWIKLKRELPFAGPGDEVTNWFKSHRKEKITPIEIEELKNIGLEFISDTDGAYTKFKYDTINLFPDPKKSNRDKYKRYVWFNIFKSDDWWLINPDIVYDKNIKLSESDYFLCDELEGVKGFVKSIINYKYTKIDLPTNLFD